MKFGLVYDFRNPERWRRPFGRRATQVPRRIRLVERLGYDAVFVTEHHFIDDGYCPSPLVALGAIAARTRRIRLGTWVALLPLYHPLRLAEDAAVVDQLSGGRLELGMGLGYREEEFAGYGIPLRHRRGRMEEGVEVLRRALAGERFSFTGRYFQLRDVMVTPPPCQQPFPLWLAARSPVTARRAARLRADLMLVGPPSVYEEYVAALRAQAEDPSCYRLLGLLPWAVAEDPERYWAEAGPHFAYMAGLYGQWYSQRGDLPEDRQWRQWTGWSPDDFRRAGMVLVGTPEQVKEGILAATRLLPYDYIVSWATLPGQNPKRAMESLELFARQAMPVVRAATGGEE
jgi:alkanesulfonate monooxygenase SsuD/methylene tetrahydromethanopterin reductase-like flavin-dependent oxidoreductase (luciferase family)